MILTKSTEYITLDWIDMAWKTTLANQIVSNRGGVYVKTPTSRSDVDRSFMDQEKVSIQDRYDFYMKSNLEDQLVISRLLREGKSVVSDRSIESTIVHHMSMDTQLDLHSLDMFYLSVSLKILLIVSREELVKRMKTRDWLTRFEKDVDHMMEVQDLYLSRDFDIVIDTSVDSLENILEWINRYVA